MRILQLNFTRKIGGTEHKLIDYAVEFKKKGVALMSCTLEGKGRLSEEFQKSGVYLHTIGITSPWKLFRLLKFIRFILRGHFDLVHVYGLKAQVLTAFLLKLLGVPAIISGLESNNDWRRWYHVAVERLSYPFLSGWVAVSKKVKLVHVQREKIDPKRIKVVHSSVNVDNFPIELVKKRDQILEKHQIPKDTFVIGNVASIIPIKGHKYLLQAVKAFKTAGRNFKVFLVGDERTQGQIPRLIRELGLENEVIVTGFVPTIKDYLPAFDVFVLPSLLEGLPISILEAMVLGIPVVASNVGGIPEVIQNGTNGYLVPPKDPNSIQQRIEELWENPATWKTLSENARKTVLNKYSLSQKVEEIISYYQTKIRPEKR